VQGIGSGADVAASLLGGCVKYEMNTATLQKLPHAPPISLIYCGYKTPTPKVIEFVEQKRQQNPSQYADLYAAIGACCESAVPLFDTQDWTTLGKICSEHQKLQQQLRVSTPEIETIIENLQRQPTIYGAKISGSGLGDCVVGIGTLLKHNFLSPIIEIPVQINHKGFYSE